MAKKIQRSFFRYQQIKSIRRLFRSIRRIQNLFRVKNEYKKFKTTQKSIRRIQKFVKNKVFRTKLQEMFKKIKEQKDSVTKIGAFFKMKRARRNFLKIKKGTNLIKTKYRAYAKNKKKIARKNCNDLVRKVIFEKAWLKIKFKIETKAAIIIQKYVRRYLTRKKFSDIVKKIQKKK